MHKYFVLIRYTFYLICFFFMLSGCDNQSDSTKNHESKKHVIVSKRITDKKADASQQKKYGVISKKITAKKDAVSLLNKAEKQKMVKERDALDTGLKKHVVKAISGKQVVKPADKGKIKKSTPSLPETSGQESVAVVSKKIIAAQEAAIQPEKDKPVKPEAKKHNLIPEIGPASIEALKGEALKGETLEGEALEEKLPMMAGARLYNPEGKIDPFEPLFQNKNKDKPVIMSYKNGKSKKKRRIPRTPLEKFDLSQLKLVGIILTQTRGLALVEDASGKGYIVKKGTFMGTHAGKLVEILKGKIVVEEEAEDIYGETKMTKRELKIHKPLGE